jgi:membrane protease YdiL (CAAX protease family)
MTSNRSSRTLTGVVHQWIVRHPIAAFLSWVFTVGQLLVFTPLLARSFYGITIPTGPFVLASTLIGLLLPTMVITRIVDGPEGLRSLWRRIRNVRMPLGWYAVALLGVPLSTLMLTVALYGWPSLATPSTIALAVGQGLLLQTFVVLLTNNLWEEVAWMGFFQARLQKRHGAMRAAVLTAPLFALQHVSLVAGNGLVSAVIVMVGVSVLAVPFRFLVGTAYNTTGSLFLVGLIHAIGNGMTGGSNFGAEGLLPRLYSGDFELMGVMHQLGTAVIGIAFVLATRGRLGSPENELSAVQPNGPPEQIGTQVTPASATGA